MFVGYDRLSYKGKDDENLRITFDSNLRSREDDLRLELGDHGKKYFDEDMYIKQKSTGRLAKRHLDDDGVYRFYDGY